MSSTGKPVYFADISSLIISENNSSVCSDDSFGDPDGKLIRCQVASTGCVQTSRHHPTDIHLAFVDLPRNTNVHIMEVWATDTICKSIPVDFYKIEVYGKIHDFMNTSDETLRRISKYRIRLNGYENPREIFTTAMLQKARNVRYLEIEGIRDRDVCETLGYFNQLPGPLDTLELVVNVSYLYWRNDKTHLEQICGLLQSIQYRRVIINDLLDRGPNKDYIWTSAAHLGGDLELVFSDFGTDELEIRQTPGGGIIAIGYPDDYHSWYRKVHQKVELMRLNCGTLARLGSDLKRELCNFLL
jgi:hypothetical protein